MPKHGFYASMAALVLFGSAIVASAAPITIFNDSLQNNYTLTVSAREALDTAKAYEGTTSVLATPSGAFDQLGFKAGSGAPAIPAGDTTLTMAFYLVTPPATQTASVANFIAQISGGSYPSYNFNKTNGVNSTTPLWTVDGQPGSTTFATNTWHVLRFDLAGAFGSKLTPGTTQLASINVQTASTNQFRLDSAALVPAVVPEPACAALLGIIAMFNLRRRRKSSVG